ncbi:efflux RND transporter permease subunit [Amphritea sp. 2_MG-2023]|jgi:multidrug efflux pump|uniref:efflux RND transporter permease subunit n=1 Tax=Amphritea TaxID=515417 RepID=UPI001C06A08D|nr:MULTISPECIES: efflux RND transporter permease subunit [Amphritea]MBU2965949.1 efflux RND transporter permease subunit [Amphritea atlantica]MDO6418039.1 efflux RND transporter permease subunit [Amphritea sp. 2_MG-2023]MDX2423781.1 efflux RND transporter permease subunit [Amphritea sp.]
MFARFFIDRPVFAWVISIIIMLSGIASIMSLPVAQYPSVAPPVIKIKTSYTGADAITVENSVTQILEQQLTGLDGLLYFSSSSTADGSAEVNITFEEGTDPDYAQVQVQNKVQQINSRLPDSVQSQGVTVTKSNSDFLLVIALYDSTDQANAFDISDYIASNMEDSLARIEGVGDVRVFGAQYAMRIWLDPTKLAAYELMPSDITSALAAQNVQVPAGKIGAVPAPANQELNATVTAQSMMSTPEQFRNIIIKHDSSGANVRLSDVARVEIGSESYDVIPRLNGHPASGIAIMLSPGANALDTATRVKDKVAELEVNLPDGYEVTFPRDSTEFIKISISEVVQTLVEAIVLVVLVMWLFLQNWRATLIPAIAVPVVLLGTFGVLSAFGFSINTLTMFGIVLSIGLLVDDAIVVVENVERLMREENLSPRDATIKSMSEISSALVGIAVVLSAVFLPMAFFGGSTGVIYQQFSIAIVSSMILSVIVALTLSPTLCASLLIKEDHSRSNKGFFAGFNRLFDRITSSYTGHVQGIISRKLRWILLYGIIVAILGVLIVRMPTGFLPQEDQGSTMFQISLPAGASIKRTRAVAEQVEQYLAEEETDSVVRAFSISGFNFSGSGQNAGMGFVALKPWDDRPRDDQSADALIQRMNKNLSSIRDASIFSMSQPVIRGLGQSNGFTFELQAAAGTSREELTALKNELLTKARQSELLTAIREGALSETPQLKIDIDNGKATTLGVSLSDVADTLTSAWAGSYVNDFIDDGRVKKVYVEGDSEFRSKPEDLNQWHVRGQDADGNTAMTPFSAFSSVSWSSTPQSLSRFNGIASYEIQGASASGVSSGQAMAEMERLTEEVGQGKLTYAWSGLSYQEKISSGQSSMLYAISILVVFLALAALYESWSVPLAVILVIPLGVIGAVLASTIRGLENDIYFQVALLTTIGLASKNAILIVEFAETSYQQGMSLVDAAVEAAKLRLRPIIMTSLAFIFGTLPLAISSGAGANSRIAIGTGIVGGTFTATLLGIFLVPLFFVLIRGAFPSRRPVYNDEPKKEESNHA